MVDYTKIQIQNKYGASLLMHPALTFILLVNEATGEVPKRTAWVSESMKIDIYQSGRIILSGSWHKHHHNNRNCNDFTLSQFVECVISFCFKFNLDPLHLHLLQLEIGVNIQTVQEPDKILKSFVCNSIGESFNRMRHKNYQSIGIELYRTEYGHKIYNKGKQFGLLINLLRYELKITNGKFFRRHGINSLYDLLSVETWQKFTGILLNSFDDLIMKEPSMRMNELTTNKRMFILHSGTSEHWEERKPQQRYKDRIRLKNLVVNHANHDLKNELRQHIIQKSQDLIDTDEPLQFLRKKGDVFPDNLISIKSDNGLQIPNSSNVGNHHPESIQVEVRKCHTCERDISMQKKGSIFCSETLFGREVKRCRNAVSNPFHNYYRAVARIEKDPSLFDQTQYLKPPPNSRPLQ